MEFTQEQQEHINQLVATEKEKWVAQELKPLQQQVVELEQYKPIEKSEKELALEQKEQELFTKEKELILKENGLLEFADFFNANNTEELQTKVNAFKQILETKNTYQPTEHKQTDGYTKAEKNKDPIGMIGNKLAQIFK